MHGAQSQQPFIRRSVSRSWGQLGRHLGGVTLTAEAANRSITCAVMIESADALVRVEEIAAVDGVDQLFVGPYDLSLSLGTTVQALLDDDSRPALLRGSSRSRRRTRYGGWLRRNPTC